MYQALTFNVRQLEMMLGYLLLINFYFSERGSFAHIQSYLVLFHLSWEILFQILEMDKTLVS